MKKTVLALPVALMVCALAAAQTPPEHGSRPDTLLIRNAIHIDGVGTPPRGPVNILVRDGIIQSITPAGAAVPSATGNVREIDAAGQYALPGFINMHAHIHGPWGLNAFPLEYIYNLWLACGITTVRDVGSVGALTLKEKEKSARGEIAAPRIYAYLWFPSGMIGETLTKAQQFDEAWLRERVRALKDMGADGMKLRHFDRDTVRVITDEAHKQGLRTANHVGVEDLTAWDNAEFGTTTIEHWYGIPDAAIHGSQSFPPEYTYANELERFRYAGQIWREADPDRFDAVLARLVEANVAWVPTFAIYDASRDLQRAVTQPAFRDYLHPAMAKYFAPDPTKHGSFFFGWTHTDEVFWKENYRIWMAAAKRFSELGGVLTTGEDAGFIYQLFGFCYLRELQLHEEAGFHPLDVIKHATYNSAKALGEEDRLGRLRPGHSADIVLIDGNPLENLHVLMPRGLHDALDQQGDGRGGVSWTIKDGYVYHAETLLKRAREIVAEARD